MGDSPGRREAGKFEPPPWEREQFEELQRLRAEQESVQRAEETEEQTPVPEVSEESARAERPEAGAGAVIDGPGVDESEAERMLTMLSIEEPPAHRGFWRFGVAASAFLAVVGGVLMIWGIVGLMRTIGSGPAGVLGGAIMITMGAGLISLGAWTAYRSLQQRGVR